MSRSVALLVLGSLLAACGGDKSSGSASATSASATVSAAPSALGSAGPAAKVIPTLPDDPEGWASCATRRAEAQKQAALPGAPKVTERAVQFARVRSRPVLWRDEPGMPFQLEKLAQGKPSSQKLVRQVRDLVNKRGAKEDKRKQVLSDNYLFAEDELLALALIEQVSLVKLFDEKTVYLQRGVDIYELAWAPKTKLDHERFIYKGGPYDGEKAEILFGDRVALTKEELESTPSLTIDLQDLMARSDFDRIKPVHLSENALVAEVRYGPGAGTWAPALFDVKGPRLELACEALTPELNKKKAEFIALRGPQKKAAARVRAVVRSMVREKIPFDADQNQQNGFARKAWTRAYLAGWRSFTIDDESHEVYSAKGEPIPPQVCIDFLTDVWERASGTWFQPVNGDKADPKRTIGAIDFDSLGIANRRSVAEFTEFASKHPDKFDVWELPKDEKIPFKKRYEFFQYLHEKADMFLPGDMITVHGYKHGGRPHYHSLIIMEQDPITGVPILVAGNAVFPREQSLEGILQISPKRTLKHRIRIQGAWVDAVAALQTAAPASNN